jgi:FixJ family two-component response regulator
MSERDYIVYIVDDDHRVCEALYELLTSLEMRVVTFQSVADYIEFPKPDLPACLVLDVELPDMSGLDLQRQIANMHHPPIVFITGHGDIPSSVRAIKQGAVDFLTKPFSEDALVQAIKTALARDRKARAMKAELVQLQLRFARLTPREREVLPLVVAGLINKQAAERLGITKVTLQVHRAQIMKKMEAESLAELVRMAVKLNVPLPPATT